MSDFKTITYKRKRKNHVKLCKESKTESNFVSSQNESYISQEIIIKRIKSAQEDIVQSVFYQAFVQSLTEINQKLQNINIVSYGLGKFSQCVTSRYQFAFLLLLKDCCKAKVFIYDPVFNSDEVAIINHLDCVFIDFNEEGKRQVDHSTIFFLPHSPKQLINNILWKNWCKDLSKCIIIGNSFEKIIESDSNRILKEKLPYVFYASSFATEIKIINSFKFSDIFNDLSIHLFLHEDIVNLTDAVSNINTEPVYGKDDIEFVTRSFQNNLSITN